MKVTVSFFSEEQVLYVRDFPCAALVIIKMKLIGFFPRRKLPIWTHREFTGKMRCDIVPEVGRCHKPR
jgi:hypothetical protein